eukprot:Clim_evm4s7 gene=Clim_evmTU4s7
MTVNRVIVHLDWTPNANHAGMILAKAQGMYKEAGLDVDFIDPETDNFKVTPAKAVSDSNASEDDIHIAVCPSESVISFNCREPSKKQAPLVAICALLQEDRSGIAVKRSSGIERPRDLCGRRYASYKARYEDFIVRRMIKNDGGDVEANDVKFECPDKLAIWQAMQDGKYDSAWIFDAHEGLLTNEPLNIFRMADYGVPYCYSPVLAVLKEVAHDDKKAAVLKTFMQTTAKGYKAAATDHAAAGKAIFEIIQKPKQNESVEFCTKSVGVLAPVFFDKEGVFGNMDRNVWDRFMDFLKTEGLLTPEEGKLLNDCETASMCNNQFVMTVTEA